MYGGSRRILIQGAVSAKHLWPAPWVRPGCGLTPRLLDPHLTECWQTGRSTKVRRRYGPGCFRTSLCSLSVTIRDSYRDVIKALKQANMQVNPKKTVIICNGTNTRNKLKKAWRAGLLPPVKITTRDLGVDTQWASW
eukprot:3803587-Amphidinium_carterae.1